VIQRSRRKPLHVTVVSDNEETLEGLRAYFDGAGVPTDARRTLRTVSSVVAATTAVVLFPDDLRQIDTVALVSRLRRARPRMLVVLVTRDAGRFEEALAPDGRSMPPLVLPKPSFGWSILDAIRAHASSTPGGRR
jgi:hypothetical protein